MSDRPTAHYASNPPPQGSMPAVESIAHDAFIAALRPLCTLLGTSPEAVFDEPGLRIDGKAGTITFTTCEPVRGVEPVAVGDVPEYAEWGWPVTVRILR